MPDIPSGRLEKIRVRNPQAISSIWDILQLALREIRAASDAGLRYSVLPKLFEQRFGAVPIAVEKGQRNFLETYPNTSFTSGLNPPEQ